MSAFQTNKKIPSTCASVNNVCKDADVFGTRTVSFNRILLGYSSVDITTGYRLDGLGSIFGNARFVCVGFEVFTAVTMKNAVFRDVSPCRSCVNRCRFIQDLNGAISQKTAFSKTFLFSTTSRPRASYPMGTGDFFPGR
jgi:hypothetical protein